jgi:SAM-dependent methyltransferase
MNRALNQLKDEIKYWTQRSWPMADVEAFFDDLAADYDEINEGAHSYFRRFTDTLRIADLPDKAHFLDFQARSGNGTAEFYKAGKVGTAVCADVSPEMGKICLERVRAAGLTAVRWQHITSYNFPFDTAEFDTTLCLESVEHFDRPDLLIKELGRVTKADGTLILSTPNFFWEPMHALAAVTGLHHSEGPHRFQRFERLKQMIWDAGFTIEHAETTVLIPAGPDWFIEMGGWIEDRTKDTLMPRIGLRRLFICKRLED